MPSFSITKIHDQETAGLRGDRPTVRGGAGRGATTGGTAAQAWPRVAMLFAVLVLGILARWMWSVGIEVLRNPNSAPPFGTPVQVAFRILLSIIAATLTFTAVYNEVKKNTSESWVAWFIAFQSGFTWDALLGDALKAAIGADGIPGPVPLPTPTVLATLTPR